MTVPLEDYALEIVVYPLFPGRIEQYFCSSGEGKKESPRRTGELPKTVMLIEGNCLVILGVHHKCERGGSSIQCLTGGIRQQSRP